ncbi:MAG: diguanylate cyclase [Desulfovibrio sp.]|jgi:diguanylate cyclase (GGDEF)-like protein|nr:diguanylate cyclase [Desulfovibrio sp.]
MDDQRNDETLSLALDHITKLLSSAADPSIPAELAGCDQLQFIHSYVVSIRDILSRFASGDFSFTITDRGVLAGSLKALQANLRHLIWQVKQVEGGDFSQRVRFLGEFSESFNSMVVQLDSALSAMKKKEEELTDLSDRLQEEVRERNNALLALEHSEAKFRYLAEHDPLTGVLNRRSFFGLAELELRRNAMENNPSSLAMLDVDHFKKFNDTYGHLEGDKALRHVAAQGKSSLRQSDIMSRFGGEEFVFLFPHADLNQGITAAERIRTVICEHPVVLDNGKEVFITASLGVVRISPNTQEEETKQLMRAISAADQALYEAKHTGRNKVVQVEMDSIEAQLDHSLETTASPGATAP